eukprot:590470-Amphidinium_carterae.1
MKRYIPTGNAIPNVTTCTSFNKQVHKKTAHVAKPKQQWSHFHVDGLEEATPVEYVKSTV